MLTQEHTEARPINQRPGWSRAAVAFVVTIVVVGAAVAIWAVMFNNGPVAAADARIEATFSGDATSYIGDREIITGIAEVTFVNESGAPAWLMIERYVTGSDELADELAFVAEGANAFPGQRPPSGVQLFESYGPGSHTVPVILAPGTYIFDAGFDNEDPAQVWRAAVIEVVSD